MQSLTFPFARKLSEEHMRWRLSRLGWWIMLVIFVLGSALLLRAMGSSPLVGVVSVVIWFVLIIVLNLLFTNRESWTHCEKCGRPIFVTWAGCLFCHTRIRKRH